MIATLALASTLLLSGQFPPPQGPIGPPPDKFTPDPAWKPLDKTNSLFFDPKERRLVLRARVCLREGFLEHLMCAEQTKEHESVFATKASPRAIHAGLLLTGAEVGHPVRYKPAFAPPAGSPMSITVEWVEDGKTKSIDAKQFVMDAKTKKPLDRDWVFAGSEQFPDPEDPKTIIYAAEHGGDLFTVANFAASILDVPFASSGNDADRSFMANTEKIPKRNTYVSLILKPQPKR